MRVWDAATGASEYRLVAGASVGSIDYSRSGALAVGADRSVIVFYPYP